MVAEPWIRRIRSSVSVKMPKIPSPMPPNSSNPAIIGILSFEVANAMSRAVNLHRSLSESEMHSLRSKTILSKSVRLLVSSDETYLLSLALAEKLDDLNSVAAVASRLGLRCFHPALIGFEHVYSDLLAGRIDPSGLGYLSKDMEGTIRKMERFVASTAQLNAELEVLNELEQTAKKFGQNPVHDETVRAFNQKIQWQRHDVKQLRSASLWNQSYDKVVLLLARAVCTIHSRICVVFGESILGSDFLVDEGSCRVSGRLSGRIHHPIHSGYLLSGLIEGRSGPIRRVVFDGQSDVRFNKDGFRLQCGTSPGRLFMDCLSLGSSVSQHDMSEFAESENYPSQVGSGTPVPFSGQQVQNGSEKLVGKSKFGPSSRLASLAAPSTIGGSALGLHYANIIIIIEKLLKYPHLVGEEARDDLYQMLPSSLKGILRKGLKLFAKSLAIYDAPVAHNWRETLEGILSWLSHMAHDMIRWQTERNFEQQQIILRSNVLLLQTLYFADREKTEAVICELLVGLNYICRYEQQQNALLDCTSSLDFDDCMEWRMQFCSQLD